MKRWVASFDDESQAWRVWDCIKRCFEGLHYATQRDAENEAEFRNMAWFNDYE